MSRMNILLKAFQTGSSPSISSRKSIILGQNPSRRHRQVVEKNWTVVAQRVHDVLKSYTRLHLTYERKVLEIRPVINWNKGNAVELLLDSLEMNDGDYDVFPIYVGDDRTDEDAFKVLEKESEVLGLPFLQCQKKQMLILHPLTGTAQCLSGALRWSPVPEDDAGAGGCCYRRRTLPLLCRY